MTPIIKADDRRRAAEAQPFRFAPLQQGAEPMPAAPAAADGRGERSPRNLPELLEARVDEHLSTVVPALSDLVEQMAMAKADWLAHWERTAIHVAAAIAARVVRRELARSPEITLTLVREALELAAGAGDIQLRLHPDDFETLGHHAGRLAGELARLGKVDVVPDPAITKGGCRVDTRFGTIDQRLEAQLARIEEELT
jgi:flagellar assembly protein FliH